MDLFLLVLSGGLLGCRCRAGSEGFLGELIGKFAGLRFWLGCCSRIRRDELSAAGR